MNKITISLVVFVTLVGVLYFFDQAKESPAYNAVTKAEMVALQQKAAAYFTKFGTYGSLAGSCSATIGVFATPEISRSISKIQKFSNHSPICRSSEQLWAVSIELRSEDGFFCVDSTGFSGFRGLI